MTKEKDTIIDVPLVNQLQDTEDKKWAEKSCGVCAIKMILAFKNPEFLKIPVMDLVKRGIEKDGYIKNVGWKHKALVDIAGSHGVKKDYQKLFYNDETKSEGLKFINKNIKSGLPVIASVHFGFDIKRGGHLIVVNGFKKIGSKIIGYFVQSP